MEKETIKIDKRNVYFEGVLNGEELIINPILHTSREEVKKVRNVNICGNLFNYDDYIEKYRDSKKWNFMNFFK